jgi:hypothetical protein
MDPESRKKYLDLVTCNRFVADAESRMIGQMKHIRDLEAAGHETSQAEALLDVFKQRHRAMFEQRARLLRDLASLPLPRVPWGEKSPVNI